MTDSSLQPTNKERGSCCATNTRTDTAQAFTDSLVFHAAAPEVLHCKVNEKKGLIKTAFDCFAVVRNPVCACLHT